MNHGLAASPFSGHVQAQRGALERWSFTMRIKRMNRADAQEAIAFFMALEGSLNTFRMGDPACGKPLGKAIGVPKTVGALAAGVRVIPVSGWGASLPGILVAGDWIQIGDQLSRVRKTVGSTAGGTCSLEIWPKLFRPVPANTPIITRNPKGIFRMTSDMPAWDLEANASKTPYSFSLTGVQEILLPTT